MAIIPGVPHVAVDIVVDGRPLPEYLDEDDEDSISSNSTTKYVECVSGSHFGVRIDISDIDRKHLRRGKLVEVEYCLDGQYVTGTVHHFPLRGDHAISTCSAARYREGGIWHERNFMFADLVTTEDGVCNKPRPELKDLGMITVKLYYAHHHGKKTKDHGHDHKKISVAHENIHEKHLKGQAISHQAKLGEAVQIREVSTVRTLRLDDAFAVFSFRYRSRRDLQTLCLIPRSPSPIPLEDRPEESLSRGELLELLRRQKARQEEQMAIKKELKRERPENDESDDELVVISSRPPARKLKTSVDASTGIESIDLSDG